MKANQISSSVHINSTLYFSKVPKMGQMMQNIQFIFISLGVKILRVLRLSITVKLFNNRGKKRLDTLTADVLYHF